MGRFYQSPTPKFVDDNMYKAPIDLMQGVLGTHEARTDELISRTDLLEGAVDQVQHLNFDAENERVKKLQEKYSNGITGITEAIYKNPLEYQKHMPAIKALQKEMLQDKNSGEWYQIEKRLGDYQNWVEENKDLKESNPTLYNKLNSHYYNDLVTRASEDSEARFAGQKGIDKPDLIQGYTKQFENIKASSTEQSNGMYKIGDKWLSEDEVSNIAWNTLISDKNYQGYVNQMGNILGEEGYVDENGRPLNAFNLVDGNGKVITYDEYTKLPEADKKLVKKQLDPTNAFYSDLAAVSQTYSFSERTLEEDQYGTIAAQGSQTRSTERLRQQGAMELEKLRQAGDLNMLYTKYALQGEADQKAYKDELQLKAAQGDAGALDILNTINAKETLGVIAPPPANVDDDAAIVEANREASPTFNDGKSHIYARPGTTEYAAWQRWNNSTQYAVKAEGSKTITLSDGTSFKAEEYFNFLGDRKHSEELSREFLEKRKGIYVKDDSVNNSTAQNWANSARWTPSWTKSEAAADWDAVYEAGNAYEEARNTWYTDVYRKPAQISLQPINNIDINNSMYQELTSNYQNYYMVDKDGDIVEDYSEQIQNLPKSGPLYVTSSNSHGEMAVQTIIDGEAYYILPNEGNTASGNVLINLSMQGVDPNSQYFLEMSDRTSSNLLHNLNATGTNSAGTKSIVTKVNGELLSLELVGDQVLVRDPDANLNSEPEAVFDNMQHFVRTMYAMP